MINYKSHPAADLWPMLKDDELKALAESIKSRGLNQAITLCEGMILDGRNRYKACIISGVEPRFSEFAGDDPYLYVFDQNGERRLGVTNAMKYGIWKKTVYMSDQWRSEQQRIAEQANAMRAKAAIGNDNATKKENSERKNSSCTSGTTTVSGKPKIAKTRAAAAESAKVDRGTVAKMDALEKSAPDLYAKVVSGELALSKAQKDAKRRENAAKKEEIARAASSIIIDSNSIDIRHCDAKDLLEMEPMNVDWIVTDPPYPNEFLHCFELLSEVAELHLSNGGSLLCMSGQSYLDKVYHSLSSRLKYHWTLGYMTPGGQAAQIFPRKVNTFWKPVLWYTKSEFKGKWVGDVCASKVNDNDKKHHHWGQSESGMYDLMKRFVEPAQTVMDPFMGAGTTGVVALELGAKFIGVDINEDHYNSARCRFASLQK